MKKVLKILGIGLLALNIIMFSIGLAQYVSTGQHSSGEEIIYLSDNGTHVDIVIPGTYQYYVYGWGSKVFFMEVPEWRDLTVTTAMQALFFKPASAMRVIKTKEKGPYWVPVKVTADQLDIIKAEIADTFERPYGRRVWVKSTLYADYFEAKGCYNIAHTCNSWVISVLKKAGLKAPLYGITSNSIMRYYEG